MSPRISRASTNCPRVTSLVGRSGAPLLRDPYERRRHGETDQQEQGDRALRARTKPPHELTQRAHREPRGWLTWRSIAAPSDRPEVTTASWAFMGPIVTCWSAKRAAALHANVDLLAVEPERVARHDEHVALLRELRRPEKP